MADIALPKPTGPGSTDVAAFGAVARLPLAVQAAFRRKLVAIVALQLVVLTGYVALLELTSRHWLQTAIVNHKAVYVVLGVVVVALLVGLHAVRDRFPLNWVVLAALTIVMAFGLAAADVVLDSHAILINCGFLSVVEIIMVATAGWTRDGEHGCSGVTFGWTPAASEEGSHLRTLVSPFLTGLVAFIVACTMAAIVSCGVDLSVTLEIVLISFVSQLIMNLWFFYQIERLSLKLTPDAYMSGVIYLYADLLVVLALAVICTNNSGQNSTDVVTSLAIINPPAVLDENAVSQPQGDEQV